MKVGNGSSEIVSGRERRAHGPWSDLALHTIGWRAFQDLCSQVCEVVLGRPVEIFREAQDGGQDAVFLKPSGSDAPSIGTIQCKHTSEAGKALKAGDLSAEIENVEQLVKAGLADTYAFMTNMSVDAPVAAAMRARLWALGVRKPHILEHRTLGPTRLREAAGCDSPFVEVDHGAQLFHGPAVSGCRLC